MAGEGIVWSWDERRDWSDDWVEGGEGGRGCSAVMRCIEKVFAGFFLVNGYFNIVGDTNGSKNCHK